MVEFGTGYYMPMDREYGQHETLHTSAASPSNNSTNDIGVGIKDLGVSAAFGPVPNVQAMGAKVRGGIKTLEIGFTGVGKGSSQGQTPEYFGKLQRQALEEIGKANEVNFTTHSTVGIMGLAGQDQQGNFSKMAKESSINEIKRAIEFAADVGRGGPVVVHTGEFHRPIVDAEWNEREDPYAKKFMMHAEEEERATYRVIDTRTGGLISEARKNQKISRPIWNYAEKSEEYKDFDGRMRKATRFEDRNGQKIAYDEQGRQVYLDYFGNRINPENRVPKFDKEHGNFVAIQMSWDDLKNEADDMTLRAKEVWREWKQGHIGDEEFKKSYWTRFKEAKKEEDIKIKPEEAYIISTLETNAANSRGWAYYYGGAFDEHVDKLKQLNKALEFYKKIEETTSEEEKWKLKRQIGQLRHVDALLPSETKYPTEIIKNAIRDEERQMKQGQEASASQWAQAEESVERIRHVESAETYALKESYDAYAKAGIAAMRETERLKQLGKYKKPIAVAMENLFPETYGSHPDEMIKLVKGSREQMKRLLIQNGLKEQAASTKADEHIMATIDLGHMNTWRKYWQGDSNKTIDENNKDFDRWAVKKLGDMVDAGIIGHIHLTDNYGYQDDHLAPGEGNTPLREMVKLLKDKGYKGEMIVEPGADYSTDASGFHSVMKAWRHFGSPVYGAGSGFGAWSPTWNQVGYGWFGSNQPPYFTFGGYSPSEDWTLWSGVQLE